MIIGINTIANISNIDMVVVGYDFESVTVRVCYITDTGTWIPTDNVILTAGEISDWGTDDGILIDKVLTKLGLTR